MKKNIETSGGLKNMKEKRYTVWQNIDNSIVDWKYDYQEAHELSDEEMKEVSENEIYNWMYEMLYEYLDDERANLNIIVPNGILVIANLGLWDGRRHGYKEIVSGKISDCLYDNDCDYCDWYCDRYDLRFTGYHHDGTNHYIYRTWADNISEEQKGNYLEKLYKGIDTHADMLKYTRSIRPYIAKVYGW